MAYQFFYFLVICMSVTTLTFSENIGSPRLLRVCYYSPPSPSPSQLNATLCTHIIAGFASVKDGVLDLGSDVSKAMYKQTTDLKKNYPALKVLLSVGGGGNNDGFSAAVGSLRNRTRFVASALAIMEKFDFDGLDVDWEFPVWNDNIPADKENFVAFMKDFKFGTAIYKSMTGNSLLLTVAVGAPKTIVDSSYNILEMAKYVDFINLMSYDFHDYFWYTPFTGYNSPLFNRSVEKAYFSTLNTAWSAMYWNNQGMPKSKIMVGIPIYAHTYTLLDPNINSVDAPAIGVGMGGGDISFPQVCDFLSSGAIRVFDSESKVPYAYKGLDWVSYEDQESLHGKAEWIKSQGYGGAMMYNLNSDDWSGSHSNVTFPLHNILYQIFNG